MNMLEPQKVRNSDNVIRNEAINFRKKIETAYDIELYAKFLQLTRTI